MKGVKMQYAEADIAELCSFFLVKNKGKFQ
jgi:hypothetical protein